MAELKKSYSFEDIKNEMKQKMLEHENPAYRRSLIISDILTDKELKFLIDNDKDLSIRERAKSELERRTDNRRRRKKTTKVINYFEYDLKGISIGNEDFEDLPSEIKSKQQKQEKEKEDFLQKFLAKKVF